jgi:hypothetical protein
VNLPAMVAARFPFRESVIRFLHIAPPPPGRRSTDYL